MAHLYNENQKNAMIKKLMDMPNNTKFDLNKNDVCPIKVRFNKYIAVGKSYLSLIDDETGNEMVKVGYIFGQRNEKECYMKLVDEIEDMIYNWDLVTKQHFIDIERQLGYDD